MKYKLEIATKKDKEVLYRLLQFSLYEESLFDLNEMNEFAIFEYKWFDDYFIDSARVAYLIKEYETNKLLGFAMINTYMKKKILDTVLLNL